MAPAIELKKEKEYDKAALSFMQASEKIKDIGEKLEAYSQACICFRKTKDYKQEISTIHLALSLLSTSTHTSKIEEFHNRLESATKLYNSKLKKKETMRNSKKGKLIANIVDAIYMSKQR